MRAGSSGCNIFIRSATNLGLDKAQMRLLERTYDGLSATARCSMQSRRRN
jgi:hypothetical protein